MKSFLEGVYTALVTPFNEDGSVDYVSFRKLLKQQHASNISGVVVCGTTGETSTLTESEKSELIKLTIDEFKGVAPVIAGVGSNSTVQTIENAKHAAKFGVDGLLVVTPYYNKPTPAGMYHHFKAVADALPALPIVLYDVPSRTGVSIPVSTVIELATSCKNIIGIKDATGNLGRVTEIVGALPAFKVTLGEDALFLPSLVVGACGVISVASNVIPVEFLEIYKSLKNGKLKRAKELHTRLYPFLGALFIESNPIPVKVMLAQLGVIKSDNVRLPLVKISKSNAEKLLASAREIGVI